MTREIFFIVRPEHRLYIYEAMFKRGRKHRHLSGDSPLLGTEEASQEVPVSYKGSEDTENAKPQ